MKEKLPTFVIRPADGDLRCGQLEPLPGGDFGGVSQTKIALKLSPNKRFLRFELKVGDILRALWKSGPKLGILDRATMDH